MTIYLMEIVVILVLGVITGVRAGMLRDEALSSWPAWSYSRSPA